jgi:hypothetical protein
LHILFVAYRSPNDGNTIFSKLSAIHHRVASDIGFSTQADINQAGVHLCGKCFKHQTRLGKKNKAKGDIR